MIERTDDRNPVDMLAEEFASRVRSGECPSVSEYVEKHPEYAEEINELLPAVAAMEQLRKEENDQRKTAQTPTHGPRNLPDWIGDYRIIREVGRGGMGVVYEAQQESLGRLVAVKVLNSGQLHSPKHLNRFHREAQSAAHLHHTNIVPVFGVGEQNGLHYYVMQLIEGVGLDQVILQLREQVSDAGSSRSPGSSSSPQTATEAAAQALRNGQFASRSRAGKSSNWTRAQDALTHRPEDSTQPGPQAKTETVVPESESDSPAGSAETNPIIAADEPTEADKAPPTTSPARFNGLDDRYWKSVARIGVQLAEALEYAHSQHVLHRDIKPSNLLLDRHDIVWITDFGLAKHAEADDLTKTGDIVGTLRYMAPEQFNGVCNRQTDIYSLGVTLFELLTLRPAFGESQQGLLMQKITTSGPERPRSINPTIPRDLETIVMKATANEAGGRYQSAGELAEDLHRFLEDRPIKARRVTTLERMWRWSRRNPAVASLAITLMLVVLSALAVISWKWREAESEKLRAQGQTAFAQKENRRAQVQSEVAVKENRRAEANLSLALDSMNQFLDRFASTWMAHPSEPLGEDEEAEVEFRIIVSDQSAAILQDALKFYNQFARQNKDNPRLQRDTANAYRRVGEIHERLGQYVRAEKAYTGAAGILTLQAEEFGSDPELAAQLAATLNNLGLVYMTVGKFNDALEQFQRAQLVLAEQLAVPPKTDLCRYELARTNSNLGHVYWRLGKHREATESHREALGLLERLVETHPEKAEYRLALARSYRSVFPFGAYGKRRGEPSSIRMQAVTILDKLVEDFPDVPDYQCELSETLANSRRWFGRSDDRENVKARLDRAVDLARQLHDNYPSIPRYQAALADALEELASHLRRDSSEEAEPVYRESISLYQSLTDDFPAVPAYQLFLSMALHEHGDLLRDADRLAESRSALESAVKRQEAYLVSRPDTGFGERMISFQYESLAKTLTKLGENDLASAAQDEAKKMRAEAERHFSRWRGPPGDGKRPPHSFRGRPSTHQRRPWPGRNRPGPPPPKPGGGKQDSPPPKNDSPS